MIVEQARADRREQTGDDVCLAALERARQMQADHGYQRVAKPTVFTGKGRPRETATASRSMEIQSPGPGWGDVGSGPRPSWRDPRPIGESIKHFVAGQGWSRQLSVAKLRGSWEEIVGATVAKHAALEEFKDGELIILASSNAWAVNLRQLLPQLEKAITDSIGEGIVEKIIVKNPQQVSWRRGPRTVPGRGPRDTYD